MPLYLDATFANRLSTRLDHFKHKSQYLWNFRCPFCGDSKKNDYKSRGYLIRKGNSIYFHCHNCKASFNFGNFLKHIDLNMYKEYTFQTMLDKNPEMKELPKKIEAKSTDIDLPTIESLPDNHVAKRYLVTRKISKIFFPNLYFTEDFKGFVDKIKPDEDRKLLNNELRIVIPFIDELNNLVGFQGRSILQSDKILRYISIRLDETSEKMVYGLNVLDQTKKIYVVEGPFDSMFLDNSVAVTNSKLTIIMALIGLHKNYTFIYDNQPRNSQVTGFMEATIQMNQPIFIWPKELSEYKDVNDTIKAGYSSSEIQGIIDSRTFTDPLMSRLEMREWMK